MGDRALCLDLAPELGLTGPLYLAAFLYVVSPVVDVVLCDDCVACEYDLCLYGSGIPCFSTIFLA